jgi:hypothetical protein
LAILVGAIVVGAVVVGYAMNGWTGLAWRFVLGAFGLALGVVLAFLAVGTTVPSEGR